MIVAPMSSRNATPQHVSMPGMQLGRRARTASKHQSGVAAKKHGSGSRSLGAIRLSHPISTVPQEFQKSGVAQDLKLLPNFGSYMPVTGVQSSDRILVLVHVV